MLLVFASIPSLEAAIDMSQSPSSLYQCVVVDVTNVCRIETAAVESLERKSREIVGSMMLILAGLSEDSVVNADLQRGGLVLTFNTRSPPKHLGSLGQAELLAFQTVNEAFRWCNWYYHESCITQPVLVGAETDNESKSQHVLLSAISPRADGNTKLRFRKLRKRPLKLSAEFVRP